MKDADINNQTMSNIIFAEPIRIYKINGHLAKLDEDETKIISFIFGSSYDFIQGNDQSPTAIKATQNGKDIYLSKEEYEHLKNDNMFYNEVLDVKKLNDISCEISLKVKNDCKKNGHELKLHKDKNGLAEPRDIKFYKDECHKQIYEYLTNNNLCFKRVLKKEIDDKQSSSPKIIEIYKALNNLNNDQLDFILNYIKTIRK